jgi:hypothetical protein
MKGYRTSQHAAFDVPALTNEILGSVLMANAFDVLLNDGTLVEICGNIMGCGTDQFYAARMGLMIWLRPLEARQEAVMDVDAATGKKGSEIVR